MKEREKKTEGEMRKEKTRIAGRQQMRKHKRKNKKREAWMGETRKKIKINEGGRTLKE